MATAVAVVGAAVTKLRWIATSDRRHYHWMDGDIEIGRLDYYPYGQKPCWIWSLFDKHDIDMAIEGQEPTAALAAHALQAEAKNPTYPITLMNDTSVIYAH